MDKASFTTPTDAARNATRAAIGQCAKPRRQRRGRCAGLDLREHATFERVRRASQRLIPQRARHQSFELVLSFGLAGPGRRSWCTQTRCRGDAALREQLSPARRVHERYRS